MKILFNYKELVIMQNECGKVCVVSLFEYGGKVKELYHFGTITNSDISGAISSVLWNNLETNDFIKEYIEAYKKSDLYKYIKRYEES